MALLLLLLLPTNNFVETNNGVGVMTKNLSPVPLIRCCC